MKKIHRLFMLVIVTTAVIANVIPAYAAKDIYKAGVLTDYSFQGNDIVTYTENCLRNTFTYLDNSGVDFYENNFNDAINALNDGSLSFIAMLPDNAQLREMVDYTERPAGIGFLCLFTAKTKQLYFDDFKHFNGIKIAILQNPLMEEKLLDYAGKNGFNYNLVYYGSIDEMAVAVRSGDVDAMLSPATYEPEGMRLIAKCGVVDYYCGVRKGDKDMLTKLNGMLKSQDNDNPFYLSQGYMDCFDVPYNNMAEFSEDDYTTSRDQKKLRVFIEDNNYPMSSYSISKGKYEGVYVDILEKIAESADMEIEYIPNALNDMETTLDSIVLGKADAILAVSGSKQGLIEATEPYTSLSFVPLAKRNAEINENAVLHVGILSDDVWITEYLEQTHSQWQIHEYKTINAMLLAAAHGNVDIALLASPDLQTKTSLTTHPSLEIYKGFSIEVPVSLGISKVTCRQQVVNMLNNIIKNVSVPSTELESRIYTLSHTYVPSFRDILYANKLWLILVLLVFGAIFAYIKMREGYFKRLERTDSLTHIYNGQYFTKAASDTMSKNHDKNYLLASVDARNFKLINDRFGTIIGDQTIINIAKNIREIFGDTGIYARMQADSFVVLVEDTPENRALIDRLDKIDIHIHDSSNYQVLVKTGVCPISHYDHKVPLSSYIDKANIAKEDSPGTNTNYTRYFTDEMASQLDTKNNIEIDMVPALRRGEFVVYYQPKYDLKTDTIIGAEALVRWYHKEKGLIPPGIFVPLFEKNGFIVEVDFCVYDQVLKLLRRRLDYKQKVVKVSMNVSRCHISDPKFVDRLEAVVEKYKIPKKYIEMEITESIFTGGDNSAFALVYELKRRGFSVSMDDFGSGYSSLNLLRKMPIDTLKIDKAFIDDIDTSVRSQYIVEEVIQMAKRIEVSTICEGVETEVQRDILKNAGCEMVQGYFYSRPLPQLEFEKLLNKENE